MTLELLEKLWAEMLIAEVKLHSGIPVLSEAEMKFRDAFCTWLEKTEDDALTLGHTGFIMGMEFSMRICRNRAEDCRVAGSKAGEMEARNCAGIIRLIQVEIGAGRCPIPDFTQEEIEEVKRIS